MEDDNALYNDDTSDIKNDNPLDNDAIRYLVDEIFN
jgi:hypothetical protein